MCLNSLWVGELESATVEAVYVVENGAGKLIDAVRLDENTKRVDLDDEVIGFRGLCE